MYIFKRLRVFSALLQRILQPGDSIANPLQSTSLQQRQVSEATGPYSDQYETIIRQGHTRPTPEFSAPTVVWHVGIWPRRYVKNTNDPCDPHDTFNLSLGDARKQYNRRRQSWIDDVNGLAKRLQLAGCRPQGDRTAVREFVSYVPPELQILRNAGAGHRMADAGDEPTEVLRNETIGFTMWWSDGQADNAIRVRVQVELNADYATFSFYMDLSQYWNKVRQIEENVNPGRRRRAALDAVADATQICEAQLKHGPDGVARVDWPAVPERLVRPDRRTAEELDRALMAARNLLYVDLWEDFCTDFNCSLDELAGGRGEVFANFRGLVLATQGLSGEKTFWINPAFSRFIGSLGSRKFPTFHGAGAEPNAVLKAFWPFMRRVTPGIDYRDCTACGVMDWRALYVSALGSSSQYDENAERERGIGDKSETDILTHERSDNGIAQEDSLIRPRVGGDGRDDRDRGSNHPVRYLFLTKLDPHPRQIGRIVERVNAMGTLRLFALKDWSAIRDADPFIRMLGQELDDVIRKWSVKRKWIDEWKSIRDMRKAQQEIRLGKTADEFDELRDFDIPHGFWAVGRAILALLAGNPRSELLRRENRDQVGDLKLGLLYAVTKNVETQLIKISASLDRIGAKCVGGLHFRLNRANYYVREFHILLDTLRVGNVPTWVAYDQFVKRGLAPAFGYIEGVGIRLRALRDRLQSVTDTIETSALVVQSEATRYNTAVLRRISIYASVIVMGAALKVLGLIPTISLGAMLAEWWHKIVGWFGL